MKRVQCKRKQIKIKATILNKTCLYLFFNFALKLKLKHSQKLFYIYLFSNSSEVSLSWKADSKLSKFTVVVQDCDGNVVDKKEADETKTVLDDLNPLLCYEIHVKLVVVLHCLYINIIYISSLFIYT